MPTLSPPPPDQLIPSAYFIQRQIASGKKVTCTLLMANSDGEPVDEICRVLDARPMPVGQAEPLQATHFQAQIEYAGFRAWLTVGYSQLKPEPATEIPSVADVNKTSLLTQGV